MKEIRQSKLVWNITIEYSNIKLIKHENSKIA